MRRSLSTLALLAACSALTATSLAAQDIGTATPVPGIDTPLVVPTPAQDSPAGVPAPAPAPAPADSAPLSPQPSPAAGGSNAPEATAPQEAGTTTPGMAQATPAGGLDDPRWYPGNGQQLADLLRSCTDATCMSYVAGAIGGLSTRAHIFGEDHPFCAGDDVRVADIRDAIVAVVDGDPEIQKAPPSFAILAAFSATWPCADRMAAPSPQASADAPLSIPIEAMTALEPGAGQELIANTPLGFDKGEPGAAALNTLTVFHDPNCIHCAGFREQTDALVQAGWRVHVVPVGIVSGDSQGYAALMAAFAQTRPDAVEALYRGAEVGKATVANGLAILAQQGITAPDALAAVSTTKAYEAITAHNEQMFALGGKGTPSWVLGDYLATGGMDAASIQDLATRLPAPPGATALTRPEAEPSGIVPLTVPDLAPQDESLASDPRE